MVYQMMHLIMLTKNYGIGYEGEMNPEAVAEYYIHSQAFSKAGDILTQVSPSLAEQESIIDSLQKVIVENPLLMTMIYLT